MCSPCAPTPQARRGPSTQRPRQARDVRLGRRTQDDCVAECVGGRAKRHGQRCQHSPAESGLARGNGWAALVDACATRSPHLLAAGAVGTDARLDPFPARGLPFLEIDDERPRSRHHDVQPPHSWRTKSVQTMCLDHEPARAWSRRYEAVHESYGSRVPLRARHACHSSHDDKPNNVSYCQPLRGRHWGHGKSASTSLEKRARPLYSPDGTVGPNTQTE